MKNNYIFLKTLCCIYLTFFCHDCLSQITRIGASANLSLSYLDGPKLDSGATFFEDKFSFNSGEKASVEYSSAEPILFVHVSGARIDSIVRSADQTRTTINFASFVVSGEVIYVRLFPASLQSFALNEVGLAKALNSYYSFAGVFRFVDGFNQIVQTRPVYVDEPRAAILTSFVYRGSGLAPDAQFFQFIPNSLLKYINNGKEIPVRNVRVESSIVRAGAGVEKLALNSAEESSGGVLINYTLANLPPDSLIQFTIKPGLVDGISLPSRKFKPTVKVPIRLFVPSCEVSIGNFLPSIKLQSRAENEKKFKNLKVVKLDLCEGYLQARFAKTTDLRFAFGGKIYKAKVRVESHVKS